MMGSLRKRKRMRAASNWNAYHNQYLNYSRQASLNRNGESKQFLYGFTISMSPVAGVANYNGNRNNRRSELFRVQQDISAFAHSLFSTWNRILNGSGCLLDSPANSVQCAECVLLILPHSCFKVFRVCVCWLTDLSLIAPLN